MLQAITPQKYEQSQDVLDPEVIVKSTLEIMSQKGMVKQKHDIGYKLTVSGVNELKQAFKNKSGGTEIERSLDSVRVRILNRNLRVIK